MSTAPFGLQKLYEAYKDWIIKNPEKASDFETTAKWVSYFVAGRINNSHLLSELVYALSNLLVFLNDCLISRGRNLQNWKDPSSKLKTWMTVLEYSEVFLELSAQKLWGCRGKWLVIISIQVLKCISRWALVQRFKESIIQSPPIPILDRLNLAEETREEITPEELEKISITLKSGKLVRRVDTAPLNRNWKPLEPNLAPSIEEALAKRQMFAEMLYIFKPIAHLCGSACFGYNTWKPWMISLLMDAGSLHLYYTCMQMQNKSLTRKQRLQLSKRTLVLIMYLMRSPFYEKHTKGRIEGLLNRIGHNIPLLRIISQPLLNYLPFWQNNYFYMWST